MTCILSGNTLESGKIGIISEFPNDILLECLGYLSINEYIQQTQICSVFKKIVYKHGISSKVINTFWVNNSNTSMEYKYIKHYAKNQDKSFLFKNIRKIRISLNECTKMLYDNIAIFFSKLNKVKYLEINMESSNNIYLHELMSILNRKNNITNISICGSDNDYLSPIISNANCISISNEITNQFIDAINKPYIEYLGININSVNISNETGIDCMLNKIRVIDTLSINLCNISEKGLSFIYNLVNKLLQTKIKKLHFIGTQSINDYNKILPFKLNKMDIIRIDDYQILYEILKRIPYINTIYFDDNEYKHCLGGCNNIMNIYGEIMLSNKFGKIYINKMSYIEFILFINNINMMIHHNNNLYNNIKYIQDILEVNLLLLNNCFDNNSNNNTYKRNVNEFMGLIYNNKWILKMFKKVMFTCELFQDNNSFISNKYKTSLKYDLIISKETLRVIVTSDHFN